MCVCVFMCLCMHILCFIMRARAPVPVPVRICEYVYLSSVPPINSWPNASVPKEYIIIRANPDETSNQKIKSQSR